MYVPPWFAETRPKVLHALISGYPLGTLVTHGPDGLDANHIPFEFEPGFVRHGGKVQRGIGRPSGGGDHGGGVFEGFSGDDISRPDTAFQELHDCAP